MSNTLKLIERVRSTTETGTDYAVAKALDMSQSTLIEIKKGKRWPGQKSQLRMSDVLKIDLKDIVALINEDKAKSERERAHWRSVCPEAIHSWLDAAGKTAAAIVIATSLTLTWGITRHLKESNVYPATHYAALRRRARTWFVRYRAASMRFSLTRSTPIPSGPLALCHGSF